MGGLGFGVGGSFDFQHRVGASLVFDSDKGAGACGWIGEVYMLRNVFGWFGLGDNVVVGSGVSCDDPGCALDKVVCHCSQFVACCSTVVQVLNGKHVGCEAEAQKFGGCLAEEVHERVCVVLVAAVGCQAFVVL